MYLAKLRSECVEDKSKVDQVVVTDWCKRLIWDSVQRYRIRLAAGILSYCVGGSAQLRNVKNLKK